MPTIHKRQWRDYETEAGTRPVKRFVSELDEADRIEVLAAMKDVRENGLVAARHLEGDIYEVRASGHEKIYRILFATEGHFSQVLLALEGFNKKTQKTPRPKIALAKKRLRDWRSRGK